MYQSVISSSGGAAQRINRATYQTAAAPDRNQSLSSVDEEEMRDKVPMDVKDLNDQFSSDSSDNEN